MGTWVLCPHCGYMHGCIHQNKCDVCKHQLTKIEIDDYAEENKQILYYSGDGLDPTNHFRFQYQPFEAYDAKAWEKRLVYEKKRREESAIRDAKIAKEIASRPACKYCGSKNTKKIGTASRMLSAGLFGLGSSKMGKQWHCNSCGSDF